MGDVVSCIVGRFDFAPNGSNDTLMLHNVIDSNLASPALPFATLSAYLDQSGFDVVSIGDPQTSIFDEIRFGTSFADVVGGGTPTDDFEAYISNPLFGPTVTISPGVVGTTVTATVSEAANRNFVLCGVTRN